MTCSPLIGIAKLSGVFKNSVSKVRFVFSLRKTVSCFSEDTYEWELMFLPFNSHTYILTRALALNTLFVKPPGSNNITMLKHKGSKANMLTSIRLPAKITRLLYPAHFCPVVVLLHLMLTQLYDI